jgi:hypothetical protein
MMTKQLSTRNITPGEIILYINIQNNCKSGKIMTCLNIFDEFKSVPTITGNYEFGDFYDVYHIFECL